MIACPQRTRLQKRGILCMKRIACIYTAQGGLDKVVEKELTARLGALDFVHITDGALIRDIVAAGGVTPQLKKRTLALFDAACAAEPDLVLCTCSSIGEVAEEAAKLHPETRILRIDYAMARTAAEQYDRVAVMATLATTVGPSVRLIERLAQKKGKAVSVADATAARAFTAMVGGDMDKATEEVLRTAETCRGAQCIVLAQASMARFADALRTALPGVPLLSSPDTCAELLAQENWIKE